VNSSSAARCRHRQFRLWMVGVAVSLGDIFVPLGEVVQPLWAGGAPMCQVKALPILASAGNVDAFGADSPIEGVVEAFGSLGGVFLRFTLEASFAVVGGRSKGWCAYTTGNRVFFGS
jgi:hypothetical protein